MVGLAWFFGAGPRFGDSGREDELLAEWVAFEAVREQQRDQVRVVGEGDAEHLEGLTLVPVRPGVHLGQRRQGRIVAGDQRADEQMVDV
jgi:hypothetical protein